MTPGPVPTGRDDSVILPFCRNPVCPLVSVPVRRGGKPAAADTGGVTGSTGSGRGGLYRRGPDLARPGVIRPAGPVPGLRARLQAVWRRVPLRLVRDRQMEPDRGAGRIPEVAPL